MSGRQNVPSAGAQSMAVAAHPTPETLAAFARGDLPPAELETVAEHIGTCNECCAVIRGLSDGAIGSLVRAAGAKCFAPPNPPAAAVPSVTHADTIPPELADHPRYKILSEIGAGGMGVVYKAHDTAMDRQVALKVMAPHLTAKVGAVERFHKEVRAAARLEHENIVRAYDMGQAGNLHFLVMEFVEGRSLDRVVAKKGSLPIAMACLFTRQAALGLKHAADKGMVHRD